MGKAWKPSPWRSWQQAPRTQLDWKRPAQPQSARSLFSFRPSRYAGFIALAAVVGAGVLFQYRYVPAIPGFGGGVRVTDRYTEIRDDKRTIRMAVRPNATAVDGDSLRVDGEETRLLGIDAPELFQTCRDERGREWPCGREAHAHLRTLVSRGTVDCASSSKDCYGRALARCSAGDIADVGEAMVRRGYALDFMGGGYQSTEAEARNAKRGIWRGEFERPADYRKRNPRTEYSRG
ncbi:MAG: thermonuclease family protein [Xanthobacteraceae bacterium]